MKVTVNDLPLELEPGATLDDVLKIKGIPQGGIATAVNGKVIPSASRSGHLMSEGDKVVIIKAFYGG